MTPIRLFTLLGFLSPSLVAAQDRPIVEIGTNLGVTIQSAGGSSLTHFAVPGAGILGQPTVYATFFATAPLLLESQIALNVLSSSGQTATTVGLGGQLGYLMKSPEVNSLFAALTVGFQSVSGGGFSDSEVGLGGKVGYRILIGTSVGLRVETGYRRWLDSDLNELTFGVGIGGIVHGS